LLSNPQNTKSLYLGLPELSPVLPCLLHPGQYIKLGDFDFFYNSRDIKAIGAFLYAL